MKAKLKKQLQSIANIPQDRVYFDVSDDLVDEMFELYDPSDLYSYLTQKERNQAYRDMQGIGANSRQIQYEWKKKALWRIAKAKAWDDLYELDESKSLVQDILSGIPVRKVLLEASDIRLANNAEFFDALDNSKEALKAVLDKAGVGSYVSVMLHNANRTSYTKLGRDWQQDTYSDVGILTQKRVSVDVVAKQLFKNKDWLFSIDINEAVPLVPAKKILDIRDALNKNGEAVTSDEEIAKMYAANTNPYMRFEVEDLPNGTFKIKVIKGGRGRK